MNKMYKVAFATGSRADYGIVRNYLAYLENDSNIELEILVTGSLLSDEYGHQVELIYKDGFQVGAEIAVPLSTENNAAILHVMSSVLDKFGTLFEERKYDLLIILGDRYEIFSVAIAAAMQKIPMLHLHGGEATFGNYDEFIRHAITKMARFHFTSTEEYRKRVIQLGEAPETVFNLGALGAENCLHIEETNVPLKVKSLKNKSYFVVLFHPETLTDINPEGQIAELLAALELVQEKVFVFIGSNADTYSNQIRNAVRYYVASHDNALYFENLHTDAYHYLVKHSIGLIGNSSSGIIEAPSLGVLTINIGDRQKGRVRSNSVIDVSCDPGEIYRAITELIRVDVCTSIYNPYFQENAAKKYYEKTREILNGVIEIKIKTFFDINFCLDIKEK